LLRHFCVKLPAPRNLSWLAFFRQEREHQWGEKTDALTKAKKDLDARCKALATKVAQLEEDKRNLEDLVSQRMSQITDSFGTAKAAASELQQSTYGPNCDQLFDQVTRLKAENDNLKSELDDMRQHCVHAKRKNKGSDLNEAKLLEMQALLEQQELDAAHLVAHAETAAADVARKEMLQKMAEALSLTDTISPLPVAEQVLLHCVGAGFLNRGPRPHLGAHGAVLRGPRAEAFAKQICRDVGAFYWRAGAHKC